MTGFEVMFALVTASLLIGSVILRSLAEVDEAVIPSWAPDFADQEAALEQMTLEHEFVAEIEAWLRGQVA